jgi:hypothetical protein
MASPTENASASFRQFGRLSRDNAQPTNISTIGDVAAKVSNISYAMTNLAEGLDQLSTGLRATYILLEQIQASLARQSPR